MDDFSIEAVNLFLVFLEQRELGEIENAIFREIHKLGVVFEVEWLKESCRRWLKNKIDSATSVEEKRFTLEESWYSLDKWAEKHMVDGLLSVLASKDNSMLISEYSLDYKELKTGKIDLLLKLGGSDTDLFFRIILQNLDSHSGLKENVKYLLQKMNLALGSVRNEALYLEVFDTISNLPGITVADLQLTNQLVTATWRLVSSRKEKERRITTTVSDHKKTADQINSFTTLKDVTKAVTEGSVISMYWVVELLLSLYRRNTPSREDTLTFITELENICSSKKLQKVSRQYLEIILTALNYSNLEQSDQIIALLKEIRNNDTLSTYRENIIIKRDKRITVTEGTEYKDLHTFKHPGTGTCTESDSRCGFIIRGNKQHSNLTGTLCTDSEDYTGTGLHYHDIISADDMYLYNVRSGNTPAGIKITVVGGWGWEKRWLPDITYWEVEQLCIAYNVTDYLVTKPE
jgi:hypothetical protein